MSNRPHKELSDKFLEKANDVWSKISQKPKSPQEFQNISNSMLNNLYTHLTYHKGEVEDIKGRKCSTENGWTTNLAHMQSDYNKLYNLCESLKDEETAIRRIENQAHRRALLFRFLTTLSIGFGIMLVYWVAQQLGIHMPLLKFPVGI